MQYFIDYITTYRNVNRKGRELQEFIARFTQRLIPDQLSLDAMKTDIEHEIDRLNKAYPHTKTLELKVYRGDGYSQWCAHVKGNLDDLVFVLSCKDVFGIYRYCEQLQQNLSQLTNIE